MEKRITIGIEWKDKESEQESNPTQKWEEWNSGRI